MDRYKFKAYYKPLKVMLQPEQIESINFETKVLGVYMDTADNSYHKLRLSDFDLLPYIVLQDMYGVEIFVGDKWAYNNQLYTVEYDERHAGYLPFVMDGGCGCCSGDTALFKSVKL